MNPNQQSLNLYEQNLRDEVIYLHSLWHQGPSTLNPNPHHHRPTPFLHVSNPTPFKTTNRTKKRKTKTNNFATFSGQPGVHPQPDPGPEWPVNSPPQSSAHTTSAWPVFEANSVSFTKPVSDIEIAELGKKKMQMKVVKSCSGFFTKMVGFDDDDDEGDGDEGDEVMEESVEESEEFKFLLNLFVENEELRKLYEDESESGEFYCLVCRGVGEKLGKKYKGCLSLLQHAIAISKTRRRRAHRAFGFVICRVVGWDFGRLPVVVIKGECLSRSLLNSQNFLYKENREVTKDLGNGENDRGATQQGEEKEEAIDCLGPESSLISDAQLTQQELPDKSHATTSDSLPPLEPRALSMRCFIPSEELEKFTMMQLQLKFVEECKTLLANPSGSNSDDDEDDGDKDDLKDDEQIKECEEFKSLMKLFSGNSELTNFYENHREDGEFCCLICCSIGKEVWKRFNGCGGLLQHATTITRTKLKRAHRALGMVICKVLNWDVAQFQTIVLNEEPLGHSLNDASILQDEQNKNNIRNGEGLNSAEDNAESVCVVGSMLLLETSIAGKVE